MSAKKENAILRAARDLFTRHGLRKTTIQDIAIAAGIGKGTIYSYFDGKEEIFSAVIRQESEILMELIREAVDREKKPQKKIEAFVRTKINYLNSFENFSRITRKFISEHERFARKDLEAHRDKEVALMTAILRQGIEERVFSIKKIPTAALFLVILLMEFYLTWIEQEQILDLDEGLEEFLYILFKGIEKR